MRAEGTFPALRVLWAEGCQASSPSHFETPSPPGLRTGHTHAPLCTVQLLPASKRELEWGLGRGKVMEAPLTFGPVLPTAHCAPLSLWWGPRHRPGFSLCQKDLRGPPSGSELSRGAGNEASHITRKGLPQAAWEAAGKLPRLYLPGQGCRRCREEEGRGEREGKEQQASRSRKQIDFSSPQNPPLASSSALPAPPKHLLTGPGVKPTSGPSPGPTPSHFLIVPQVPSIYLPTNPTAS